MLWSSGFTFVKLGLAHAGPMSFLALRYALVVAILLPLSLALRLPWPRGAAAWRHLVVLGVLIQVLYFGLTYVAIALGLSPGGMGLIVSLQPIVVALLAPRLAGERVGARHWAGLLLGLAGAAIVIAARSQVRAESGLGALAATGALLGLALGALYEKRHGAAFHPVTSNLAQNALGLAASLPLAWGLEAWRFEESGALVTALLYLVLANSLVSLMLLVAMIRHGEVSRVSAFFFLVAPTSALAAWLLLGDAMSPLAWLGIALAASGVALAARAPRLAAADAGA